MESGVQRAMLMAAARTVPMGWPLLRAIVVIRMARSSHLGQVLLRERMPLPALFLNLDGAQASDEEKWERELNVPCPWPPREPSRWDGRRRPWSASKVQVKASSRQIFEKSFLEISENTWEYTSLALVL